MAHEHRAIHGVSRAWAAAGHAVVVAGAVVVWLSKAENVSAIECYEPNRIVSAVVFELAARGVVHRAAAELRQKTSLAEYAHRRIQAAHTCNFSELAITQ